MRKTGGTYCGGWRVSPAINGWKREVLGRVLWWVLLLVVGAFLLAAIGGAAITPLIPATQAAVQDNNWGPWTIKLSSVTTADVYLINTQTGQVFKEHSDPGPEGIGVVWLEMPRVTAPWADYED